MTYNRYVYEMDCLGESICNNIIDADIMNENVSELFNKFKKWLKDIWDAIKKVVEKFISVIKNLILKSGVVHGTVKINLALLKSPKAFNFDKLKRLFTDYNSSETQKYNDSEYDDYIKKLEDIKETVRNTENAKVFHDGDSISGSEIAALKSWITFSEKLVQCRPNELFSDAFFVDNDEPGEKREKTVHVSTIIPAKDIRERTEKFSKDVNRGYFGTTGSKEKRKEHATNLTAAQYYLSASGTRKYFPIQKIRELSTSILSLCSSIAQQADRFAINTSATKFYGKDKEDSDNYVESHKRVKLNKKLDKLNPGSKEYKKNQEQLLKTESAININYLRAQLLIEAADTLADNFGKD